MQMATNYTASNEHRSRNRNHLINCAETNERYGAKEKRRRNSQTECLCIISNNYGEDRTEMILDTVAKSRRERREMDKKENRKKRDHNHKVQLRWDSRPGRNEQ